MTDEKFPPGEVMRADTIRIPAVKELGQDEVKQMAAGAMRWSAFSRAGAQVFQFLSLIALARLLDPKDFGLAAVVLVISNFALMLSDLGLGAALVHTPILGRKELDSVFWLNFIIGLVLTVVVAALAYPLALLYHQPQITGLTILASVTYTASMTVVPLAVMERNLNLRPAAICEVIANFVGSAAGVIAAWAGCGAYSLVIAPLVTTAMLSLTYLYVTKYYPRTWIDRATVGEVWRYSRGITGFNLVNFWTRNADNLLLGKFSGPIPLGYYDRAFKLMLLPVQQIQIVIGRVLFPALTKINNDPKRLLRAHRDALVVSSAVCAPLAAGLAACSHDFVLALFGDRWRPMIPVLALLASTGVQQVFQGTVGTLYQAIGRTEVMFKVNLIFTAITLAAFVVGVHWGAIGMAAAVAIRGWALLPVTLSIPLRLIGDSARAALYALRFVVLALIIEVAAVLGVYVALNTVVSEPLIRLVAEVAAGGLAYLIALSVLAPSILQNTLSFLGIKRSIRPSRPRARHRAIPVRRSGE